MTPAQCGSSAGATAGGSSPADEPAGAGPAAAEEDDDAAPAADGNYRLTVRSNVYYDEVYINGVAYGSTKLDVMLPAGEYDLEIRKPGHTSYKERITLDRARTVKAELAELGSR
jgi:hypothetical protein